MARIQRGNHYTEVRYDSSLQFHHIRSKKESGGWMWCYLYYYDNESSTYGQRYLLNGWLPIVLMNRKGVKWQEEVGEQDEPYQYLIMKRPEDHHSYPAQKYTISGQMKMQFTRSLVVIWANILSRYEYEIGTVVNASLVSYLDWARIINMRTWTDSSRVEFLLRLSNSFLHLFLIQISRTLV